MSSNDQSSSMPYYLVSPLLNPISADKIPNTKLIQSIMSTTMLNSVQVAQISMGMALLMRVLILVKVTPVVH